MLHYDFVDDQFFADSPEENLHFMVWDDCSQEEVVWDPTPTQREWEKSYARRSLSKFLFYIHASLADSFFGEAGEITLRCPRCRNVYRITRGEYLSALERYRQDDE